ncbi:MAG TPA: hypothetical protein VK610_10325, partial [Rhodothermales bacterium]|nr:hypothetical protein [Rhodothermales bacterium]
AALDALYADEPGFTGDNGPGAPPVPARVDARVDALVSEATGLRYDSLVLFAEPLFQQFGLDLADAFALRENPRAAEPEVVALLEAARLLWSYFELPAAERDGQRAALATHLLGAEPTEADWAEVEAVLAAVEPYWEAMSPEERAASRKPGTPWLDWDALMAHPAFQLESEHAESTRGFGPEGIGEMEARALFAQPLVEAAAADGDVDALEAAIDRATHYWTIATAHPGDQAGALDEAVATLAGSPAERPAVAEEARQMLARYQALFPEHAG